MSQFFQMDDSDQGGIDEQHIIQFEQKHSLQRIERLIYPFVNHCRIATKYPKGEGIGTGCLLSYCIVLTCLHNLLRRDKKSLVPVKSIQVHVSQNGPAVPEKVLTVKAIKYNPMYFSAGDGLKGQAKWLEKKKYDYALLLLEENDYLKSLDPHSFLALSIAKLDYQEHYNFELYGYDYEYNRDFCLSKKIEPGTEYHLFGCLFTNDNMDQDFIQYQVTTEPGKSGAPILSYSGGGLHSIKGIHLGTPKNQQFNFGLRINERVLADINSWRQDWMGGSQQIPGQLKTVLYIHEKPSVALRKSTKITTPQLKQASQSFQEKQKLVVPAQAGNSEKMGAWCKQPVNHPKVEVKDKQKDEKEESQKQNQKEEDKDKEIEQKRSKKEEEIRAHQQKIKQKNVDNEDEKNHKKDEAESTEKNETPLQQKKQQGMMAKIWQPFKNLFQKPSENKVKIDQGNSVFFEQIPEIAGLTYRQASYSEAIDKIDVPNTVPHTKSEVLAGGVGSSKPLQTILQIKKLVKQPLEKLPFFRHQGPINAQLILQMSGLKTLSLKNCGLIKVPHLGSLSLLKEIDCSFNLIVEMEPFMITSIVKLTLENNRINKVPGEIINCSQLRELSLSGNTDLKSMHKNILELVGTFQRLIIRNVGQFVLTDRIFKELTEKIEIDQDQEV